MTGFEWINFHFKKSHAIRHIYLLRELSPQTAVVSTMSMGPADWSARTLEAACYDSELVISLTSNRKSVDQFLREHSNSNKKGNLFEYTPHQNCFEIQQQTKWEMARLISVSTMFLLPLSTLWRWPRTKILNSTNFSCFVAISTTIQ